jgi:DNA-binding winged helix-turn-helix (wHTH) protein/tetratricopeptide (TPR) repeat protein
VIEIKNKTDSMPIMVAHRGCVVLKKGSIVYRFACFTLDPARSVLSANGEPLPVARKVVDTLSVLVENAGAVTTKAELMDRLWPDGFVEESNLSQNVYVLRSAFKSYGVTNAIQTVPRRGYRFALPVRTHVDPALKRPRFSRRIGVAIAACLLAVLALFTTQSRNDSNGLAPHDRQLYVLGRYYWSLRTVPALHRSAGYFQRVVHDAPKSALGYAGLADAYLGLYDYECDGSPCTRYARLSNAYAHRAVRADDRSAAAHASLGMTLRVFEQAYSRSDAEFRRAIALDPHYAPAHEWYGNSLLLRGRVEDARRELETAAVLDPVSPATYGWLARAEYYGHRYRRAIGYAREALALDPSRHETRLVLGLSYEQIGDREHAVAVFRNLEGSSVLIAGVDARTGATAKAKALISRSSGDDLDVALDLIALGQYADALPYFKRVSFKSDMNREFLALDPRLDAVRTDSRFRTWI